MHVPFIIRWTGKIKTGADDLLFPVPDIFPTLLSLMGFKDDIPGAVEGTDHSGLMTTGKILNRPTSQFYFMTDGLLFDSPAGTNKLNLASGEGASEPAGIP